MELGSAWNVAAQSTRNPPPGKCAPPRPGKNEGPEKAKARIAAGLGLGSMAEWTGLEPATSGVTGQHSNRLNYHSAEPRIIQTVVRTRKPRLVGAEGFEPPTLSV